MTATDSAFVPPSGEAGVDGARPDAHASMLAEIEALAALVGEDEERSASPIPAPIAPIAQSRPMLVPDAPAIEPLAADILTPQPDTVLTTPPLRPDAVMEPPAPSTPSPQPEFTSVAADVPVATTPPLSIAPVESAPLIEVAIASVEVSAEPIEVPIDAIDVIAVPAEVAAVVVDTQTDEGDPSDDARKQVSSDPDAPTPFPSGVLNDDERLVLLDAMPVSVFLIDTEANIRYTNVRTATMVGIPRHELLGRNVLDFINVDDLDFVAALFNGGPDFADKLMGPSRIRYVDNTGQSHWTQVWAQSSPPELGVDGYIITLTNESVRDVLATAVSSVTDDDSLDHTMAAVAQSARALPFEAIGAVLMTEAGAVASDLHFRMIGDWPIDHGAINAPGTPWRQALAEGRSVDIDDVATSGLTSAARDMLRSAGVEALFVRPISDLDGSVVGVFVVFRDYVGAASPNQNDHLEDAVRLAGLAIAQKRRRIELEQAVHRDALTGVGNRAAFNDRLKTERRALDVLFIDLDHFKSVNDTFGHDTGDQVVSIAAARIDAAVRSNDTVYRTGGDEFVVLCEASGDDPTERVALAERIVQQLQLPFDIGTNSVTIGATVGIAAAGAHSLDETVRAADRALYRAKELGRSGWAHDDH